MLVVDDNVVVADLAYRVERRQIYIHIFYICRCDGVSIHVKFVCIREIFHTSHGKLICFLYFQHTSHNFVCKILFSRESSGGGKWIYFLILTVITFFIIIKILGDEEVDLNHDFFKQAINCKTCGSCKVESSAYFFFD